MHGVRKARWGLAIVLALAAGTPAVPGAAAAHGGGPDASPRLDGYVRATDHTTSGSAVNAAPIIIVGAPYRLRNVNSSKCLTIQNVRTDNTAPAVQYDCDFWAPYNEVWRFYGTGRGSYQIRNEHSGRCLTVLNARTDDNAPVIQYGCENGWPYNEAWWAYYNEASDTWMFQNEHSGRCITIWGATFNNNEAAVQYTCETNPPYNERWRMHPGLT